MNNNDPSYNDADKKPSDREMLRLLVEGLGSSTDEARAIHAIARAIGALALAIVIATGKDRR